MKRKLAWKALILFALLLAIFGGGLWFASSQLLFPVFRGSGHDLSVCNPETTMYWGDGCGNLRETQQFVFSDVRIPSSNGYDLPAWFVRAEDNGRERARGAIMLVPAGGSDRRENTKHIAFFLGHGLDVVTLDLGCQGEAPCPTPGLTYGQRESRDVLAAYNYLIARYDKVYAMGSSVGASSILVALPDMPRLTGVIAENPFASFQRLIREAPESQSMPGWATDLLLKVAMLRGGFDGAASAERALPIAGSTPILFIHSKADKVVSYKQTEDLAALYKGAKTVWLPEYGGHAEIWDVDHAAYEKKIAEFLGNAP